MDGVAPQLLEVHNGENVGVEVALSDRTLSGQGRKSFMYRYAPKTYANFMMRDKPHPIRAVWGESLNGTKIRRIEDFRMYDGKHHSKVPSKTYHVGLQGSPNGFVEARLRAFKQNLGGQHLTYRANLILTAREKLPSLNEKLINDLLNQRILDEICSFTAQLQLSTTKSGETNNNNNNSTSAQTPTQTQTQTQTQTLPELLGDKQTAEEAHGRRLAALYSERSGRLIPPSSRSGSRPGTRESSAVTDLKRWKHGGLSIEMIADPKQRIIIDTLCQLLQTDDLTIVAAWIGTASALERSLLINLLDLAVSYRLNELNDSQSQLSPNLAADEAQRLQMFSRSARTAPVSMTVSNSLPSLSADVQRNQTKTASTRTRLETANACPSVMSPYQQQEGKQKLKSPYLRLSLRRNLPQYDYVKDVYA